MARRAAVAAGLVAAATASDGGGLDPHPGRLLTVWSGMKPSSRGRVSSAPADAGWLGLSVFGALARTVQRQRAAARRHARRLPGRARRGAPVHGSYVAAAAAAPSRLRIAVSEQPPPGDHRSGELADQRGAWDRTAAAPRGISAMTSRTAIPTTGWIQFEFLQMWLRGIYEEAAQVPDPSRLEKLPPGRWRPAGATWCRPAAGGGLLERRAGDERAHHEACGRSWTCSSPRARRGRRSPAEGGFGRSAPVAINIAGRFTPFTAQFNCTGQPAITIPAGLERRRAARSACSWWAGSGPRMCSTRWPARSSRPRPGPGAGRRWRAEPYAADPPAAPTRRCPARRWGPRSPWPARRGPRTVWLCRPGVQPDPCAPRALDDRTIPRR